MTTIQLRKVAASVANATRPWVASDAEAIEFSNNFVAAMHDGSDANAAATEMLTHRVRNGWITCGDIAAAATCVARRWHQETSIQNVNELCA